jgi:hypothetical protein
MLSAAAVVLMTAGVLAQAKPDFSGKWTMDAPAAAPGGAPGAGGGGGRGGRGGGGGWGMNPTITQDATTLKVEYMGGGQNPAPVTMTYKLDGTESKNSVMGRGGQATEQVSKATVEGATIKIVTTTGFGEQTRTISMDGGKMKIVTSQNGPDGTPISTTVTYSKAP